MQFFCHVYFFLQLFKGYDFGGFTFKVKLSRPLNIKFYNILQYVFILRYFYDRMPIYLNALKQRVKFCVCAVALFY